MEFNFPLAPYFRENIIKIGPRLLPDGFTGERREVQECFFRISTILTEIGESSAKAQGLQRVITSGDRLRNSDHTVYLIADIEGGSRGNGVILGMLKVGVKHLYLFDSSGNNHEVYANCILDFYVHESQQRKGIGKQLFDHMLQVESSEPQHLAVDKPSQKLLSFLDKHYGLNKIIPQMNNFVVYDGFFDNRDDHTLKENCEKVMAAGLSSSTSRNLSGGLGTHTGPDSPRQQKGRSSSVSDHSPSTFGRPPAHRPISTMASILGQQSAQESNISAASTTAEPPVEPVEIEESEEVDVGEVENVTELEAELEQLEVNEEVVEDSPGEVEADAPIVEPVSCKVQANTPTQHMDLKFYHSSLW